MTALCLPSSGVARADRGCRCGWAGQRPSHSRPQLCRRINRAALILSAAADGGGDFFSKLARVIKEKGQADFDLVFKGTAKTRASLSVVDELLTYWNLDDSDKVLEELEEALIIADFGPRTSLKIVDLLREEVKLGHLKTPSAIKVALQVAVAKLLAPREAPASSRAGELAAASPRPAVILVVGVNGGGKTTTIGKLAHRLTQQGQSVMVAAGDTFRAAAGDQLAAWAERAGARFHAAKAGQRPGAVLFDAANAASVSGAQVDVLLCDTSGRLHTNAGLMEELSKCGRSLAKALPGAPHEVLLVLDGTTGLNMLAQAREFKAAAGVTGLIVTKLDGTARGGCVVSVVDELGLPIRYIGVGESADDLQPFDAETFAQSILPTTAGAAR